MAAPAGRGASRGGGGSLRGTLLAVALLVALPFLALIGVLAWGQVTGERERVQSEALSRATQAAAMVERVLSSRLDGVATMASMVVTGSAAAAEAQARRLRQSFPDLERVTLVDELGLVVAGAPPGDGRRGGQADQEWFKQAATSTEPFVSGARASGPDVVIGLYAPVRAGEGQFRGVVAAELTLRPTQAVLAQSRRPEGGVLEVVNEDGRIVARQPPIFLLQEVADPPGLAALTRGGGGTGELAFADGQRRLVGAAPIRGAGWFAVAGVPVGALGPDTWRRVGFTVGAALGVTVLAVGGALVVGRRQARGLDRLRIGMRRVAAGEMPAVLPVTVGGEVGALTEAYNRMLAWFHNRVREYEVLSQVADEAGAAAGGSASADGMLPRLLRKVVNGMGADAGVVQVRDGAELVTKASVGLHGLATVDVRLRRGRGVGWAVLAERASLVVPDVEADYRVEEPYLREAGLRVLVGSPIVEGDEPVGAVLVGYRRAQAVGEAEMQRLEAMARRTAQALEHARAFDAVRLSTAGLEAQVAEQLEALQRASRDQAEARRQAQEAARKAQEMEQAMRAQADRPPEIREVIVEKEVIREREVVRHDGAGGDESRLRAEMQKTVSEELRAPLSALLDLPRFLVEGLHQPLAQEERQQLEVLRDRGEEILELIDSLVVLTSLEAGEAKVVKAPFDLPGLVQRVVRVLQPRAAAKGNRIEADIKLHLGQVISDARRVEEILTGLLVNAIRYTEVGEIKVTCYLRDADVVIVVSDDGAGFAPEEADQIFTPFLQVGRREGRRLPGTGLTLTVCARLVAVLGGRIKMESEVDRGTWFTVTLPGAAG